jgi:predicted DNA-binding WGR domain protein
MPEAQQQNKGGRPRNPNGLKCDICDKEFDKRHALANHKSRVHRNKEKKMLVEQAEKNSEARQVNSALL